jgi:biopolymer transport protein ExbD
VAQDVVMIEEGPITLNGGGAAGGAKGRRLESTFFMINVIFLLLLFFVVAGNLNLNIDVSPPRADSETALTPAPQLVIDANGQLAFNGVALSLAAVEAEVKQAGPLPELVITADSALDAVLVAKVLDALAGLDIERVSLLTLGRAAPEGG